MERRYGLDRQRGRDLVGSRPVDVALAADVVSALFLRAPDDALLAALSDSDAAADWPLEDPASRTALATLASEGPGSTEELRNDHFMLFCGPGRGDACPYESVRLADDQLLFGVETDAVRAAYSELGLVAQRPDGEPEDHIGFEFGFVGACAHRLAHELLAEERAHTASLLSDFLELHLDRLAPLVLADVEAHARTATYRALPVLARGVLAAAHELVS